MRTWYTSIFLLLLAFSVLQGDDTPSIPPNFIQRSIAYAQQHQHFKEMVFPLHEREFLRLAQEGQAPKTLFIGCSDSRVIPELILAAGPGELFVLRTAGNFVPIYDTTIAWDGVAATLQYAVEVVGVKDIIICGHSHCGAIAALMDEKSHSNASLALIERWLRFGKEAKELTLNTLPANAPAAIRNGAAERFSVLYQLQHLLTYPFVARLVATQKLYLHGWYFAIDSGKIEYYDPSHHQFLPLDDLLPAAQEKQAPAMR